MYDIKKMDEALSAKRFTMPQGLSKEERRELILASQSGAKFDMERIEASLNSGEPIRIPHGLSREEMREFIIKNR